MRNMYTHRNLHLQTSSDVSKKRSFPRLTKNSHNKIRESSKESRHHERPRTAVSVAAEIRLPPECIIKSLSILPGMALQRRMPPRVIMGSDQCPWMESPTWKMDQIRKSNRIQCKSVPHNSEISCAGWFCDFVICFSVAMWEAQKRVYILSGASKRNKKKFIKIVILKFIPGKAQSLAGKRNNSLAAVETSRKALKHCIVRVVLLQS